MLRNILIKWCNYLYRKPKANRLKNIGLEIRLESCRGPKWADIWRVCRYGAICVWPWKTLSPNVYFLFHLPVPGNIRTATLYWMVFSKVNRLSSYKLTNCSCLFIIILILIMIIIIIILLNFYYLILKYFWNTLLKRFYFPASSNSPQLPAYRARELRTATTCIKRWDVDIDKYRNRLKFLWSAVCSNQSVAVRAQEQVLVLTFIGYLNGKQVWQWKSQVLHYNKGCRCQS